MKILLNLPSASRSGNTNELKKRMSIFQVAVLSTLKKLQKHYFLIYIFMCICVSSHFKVPLEARVLFYSSFLLCQSSKQFFQNIRYSVYD